MQRCSTRRISIACVIAVFLIGGCDGGPTAPTPGILRVTVSTTGGDIDLDGYELLFGSRRFSIPAQRTIVFDTISAGPHTMELTGIAANCSVDGSSTKSVIVEPSMVTNAVFAVTCDATGIAITASTAGADMPSSLRVSSGDRNQVINTNSAVVMSRLNPGSYAVSIDAIPENCAIDGDNRVTVEVTNRKVTPVSFALTCARTEKRVAYVLDSANNSNLTSWITVAAANGSTPLSLVMGSTPAWSPDGARIAYSDFQCEDYYYYYQFCTGGLFVMDVENRKPAVALAGGANGLQPAWSPNGRYIAFTRDAGIASLFVMDLGDSSSKPIFLQGIPGSQPSWSPDSEHLVFECQIGLYPQICSIKRDGSDFRQLTSDDDAMRHSRPRWSPDGSRIAMTTYKSNLAAISVMNADGSGLTRLADGYDAAWSRDGGSLIFARENGLFTMRSDGSDISRLTSGRHHAPAWRP